jgi:hypothetical protein
MCQSRLPNCDAVGEEIEILSEIKEALNLPGNLFSV